VGPLSAPSIDAVIFDCDGVLVDSEPIAGRLLAELLCEIGLPTTHEDVARDFLGRSWTDILLTIELRLGGPVPPHFEATCHTREVAAFAAELTVIDGIEAALDAIAFPRCVASSGHHEGIRRRLKIAGLADRFDDAAIFSATDVTRGKPAPDLFLHAAARMGFEPATTAVVEDSPAGVEAGVAAGMTVFGYAAATPAERLRALGATPFTDMRELPALLATFAAGQKA
jgi:HAD superfamily hydrolase (TIGR01509 family)